MVKEQTKPFVSYLVKAVSCCWRNRTNHSDSNFRKDCICLVQLLGGNAPNRNIAHVVVILKDSVSNLVKSWATPQLLTLDNTLL